MSLKLQDVRSGALLATERGEAPGSLLLLRALFVARHAASTQYWADVVNTTCHTIDDLRAVMARRVPPPTADYYFGAADREITMGENERALREARFKPRMGLHLDTVTMHTTVLGQEISLPVIAAPVGSLRNLWPRGEAVAGRFSARARWLPRMCRHFAMPRATAPDCMASTSKG